MDHITSGFESNCNCKYSTIYITCKYLLGAGMKPLIYSVKEATRGRPFWVRSGSEVCYFRNAYRRPGAAQAAGGRAAASAGAGGGSGAPSSSSFSGGLAPGDEEAAANADGLKRVQGAQPPAPAFFSTLSFCLKFKHRNDVVYVAYHFPYSYSTLLVRAHFSMLYTLQHTNMRLLLK